MVLDQMHNFLDLEFDKVMQNLQLTFDLKDRQVQYTSPGMSSELSETTTIIIIAPIINTTPKIPTIHFHHINVYIIIKEFSRNYTLYNEIENEFLLKKKQVSFKEKPRIKQK